VSTNHGVQHYGGTSHVGVQAVGTRARAEADHVELTGGASDAADNRIDHQVDNQIDGTIGGGAVQAGTINGPVTINVEPAPTEGAQPNPQ
jgi:hypothetical protein